MHKAFKLEAFGCDVKNGFSSSNVNHDRFSEFFVELDSCSSVDNDFNVVLNVLTIFMHHSQIFDLHITVHEL
jgi:hypothetical protein